MALLAETGSTPIEPLQGTTVNNITNSNANGWNAVEPLQGTTVLNIAQSSANAFNVVEPLQGTTVLNIAQSSANAFNVVEPLQWTIINNLPISNQNGFAIIEVLAYSPIPGFLTPYGTGTYTISGTVQNGLSAPLGRTVVAYDRFNKIPLDIVISNSVTGAFTLNVPYTSCYVVCLPDLADGVNAEIYDQITPVP